MLLAGVGFLLPYNSFITDVDYLHHKFPGVLNVTLNVFAEKKCFSFHGKYFSFSNYLKEMYTAVSIFYVFIYYDQDINNNILKYRYFELGKSKIPGINILYSYS